MGPLLHWWYAKLETVTTSKVRLEEIILTAVAQTLVRSLVVHSSIPAADAGRSEQAFRDQNLAAKSLSKGAGHELESMDIDTVRLLHVCASTISGAVGCVEQVRNLMT